jgi:hypothetical protein
MIRYSASFELLVTLPLPELEGQSFSGCYGRWTDETLTVASETERLSLPPLSQTPAQMCTIEFPVEILRGEQKQKLKGFTPAYLSHLGMAQSPFRENYLGGAKRRLADVLSQSSEPQYGHRAQRFEQVGEEAQTQFEWNAHHAVYREKIVITQQ